jgi:thiol:disulfide interchange protein DsbD
MYDIAMPQSLSRVAGETRQGVLGSLFMGLTVGIIAAPCIGPFVLALLTYVGATGNPVIGFSVFFVLALGLGIPFMVLAVVSGSVSALPRSGGWMVWVKKVFGFVMIGMAIYFLTRSPKLVPEALFLPLVAATAIIGGVYLGWIEKSTSMGGGFNKVKRAVGVLMILLGIGAVVAPRFMVPPEGIEWTPFAHEQLAEATGNGMPVIVDFSAAWCIPCKELDHYTFATPTVVERAHAFVTLKADLTESGSPAVKAIKEQFGVLGVPTVIFLAPDGTEMEDLRFTGLIKPEDFLARMESALERI